MKILAKIKKRSLILGILFTMLLIGIVYAAEYYQVNSGAQATINEWSVCKKVTNNNALAIFVPTKTEAEWTAFRTYASGVTYASCCSALGVACSSDANCCSAICGTNADGDAYFSLAAGHTGTCQASSKPYTDCCDTDVDAYPGQTTYYATINNCSSWDYNCDSIVTKSRCDKMTSCPIGDCTGTNTRLCDPIAEPCTSFTSVGTSDYYACGADAANNSCRYSRFKTDCTGSEITYAFEAGMSTSWAYGIIYYCGVPTPEPYHPGGTNFDCKCR